MLFRTRPLDVHVDLNDVCRGDGMLFVRDGVGAAGRGSAAVVMEEDLDALLDSLQPVDGEVPPRGHGPHLFGVVPFLPRQPARFVLPRTVVTKDLDGRCCVTVVGPDPSSLTDSAVDEAVAAVGAARDAVRAGQLLKAVIARDVSVTAREPIDVHAVLLRLRASFGSSYRFCVDGLIGASPELLVQVQGRTVRSHPLAGTAPRTGDPATDARLAAELVASTKNQVEHRVVIDMVHDTLLPWCSYLDWEPEPSIVTVANVQHLGTAIEGALSEPRPAVMTLVRALCPTPALGGSPSAGAIEFIETHEPMERGNYGGAVGIVDRHGDGTFAVTIRCAEFSPDRRTARLFAGGGIVAESDPPAELAETQAKFQAMLSAIVRP
jgi:menaquinone-specific isochorismate synthase